MELKAGLADHGKQHEWVNASTCCLVFEESGSGITSNHEIGICVWVFREVGVGLNV